MTRAGWKHKINIGDFWRNEDVPLEVKARHITTRLSIIGKRLSGFAEQDLLDLLFDLRDAGRAEDVAQFDAIWSEVYDWADHHRVWIDTLPPRRPEPETKPVAEPTTEPDRRAS